MLSGATLHVMSPDQEMFHMCIPGTGEVTNCETEPNILILILRIWQHTIPHPLHILFLVQLCGREISV